MAVALAEQGAELHQGAVAPAQAQPGHGGGDRKAAQHSAAHLAPVDVLFDPVDGGPEHSANGHASAVNPLDGSGQGIEAPQQGCGAQDFAAQRIGACGSSHQGVKPSGEMKQSGHGVNRLMPGGRGHAGPGMKRHQGGGLKKPPASGGW